jgi:ribose transport system substrate-binding protein
LDKTLSQIEDFILAYPDLSCFFGLNDQVALMMVGSVDAAGFGDKIKVYGVDGSPAGKASIAAGGLAGTAAQSFKRMGNTAAELAYKVLAGEKLEPLYSIDTIMITRDNIGEFALDVFE